MEMDNYAEYDGLTNATAIDMSLELDGLSRELNHKIHIPKSNISKQPHLKNTITHEIVKTQIKKIDNLSELKQFNSKNGWYVNWTNLAKDKYEIYALKTPDNETQALLSIKNDKDVRAASVAWIVVAPHNNKQLLPDGKKPKYENVGGPMFAIAAKKSIEYGYNGDMVFPASNNDLYQYYKKKYYAHPAPFIANGFGLAIYDEDVSKIMEEYHYE